MSKMTTPLAVGGSSSSSPTPPLRLAQPVAAPPESGPLFLFEGSSCVYICKPNMYRHIYSDRDVKRYMGIGCVIWAPPSHVAPRGPNQFGEGIAFFGEAHVASGGRLVPADKNSCGKGSVQMPQGLSDGGCRLYRFTQEGLVPSDNAAVNSGRALRA